MRIGKITIGRARNVAAPAAIKIGLFCGGNSGANLPPRTYVDKYKYADNTVAAGTVLRTESIRPAAASNTTTAVSVYSSSTDLYTYASGTWAAASAFNGTLQCAGSLGISTRAIFEKSDGTEATVLLQNYSYSGASWSSATSLNTKQSGNPACNTTATVGYVSGGYGSGYAFLASTQKYTYSSNAISTGGSMGTARYSVSGYGNTTYGLIAGGYSNLTTNQKYTYSTDAVSSATTLNVGAETAGPASNPVMGLLAGGAGSTSAVRKYTWSGETVSAGTALGLGRAEPSGTSSEPGAF